jgi:cell fate (sporulation/competence/biofilm development) regulator YmcA (YheA/YmcA/DUF963 family)
VSNSIFDDLEIDHTTMMTDPQEFCHSVYNKVDELRNIIKASSSIAQYINSLSNTDDMDSWKAPLEDLYSDADANMSVKGIMELAKLLRQMATDMETMAKNKATYQLAASNSPTDKSLALIQYTRLRDAFNPIVDAFTTLKLYDDATKIPPMQGNFSTPVGLIHIVFEFANGEGYMNPIAACKKLGIEYSTLAETIEYIENNPQSGCTVKRLSK